MQTRDHIGQHRAPHAETHLEDGIDTLPLRIPYSAQPITGYRTTYQPRHVRHNEPQRTPAQAAHHTPELAGRLVSRIRHALLPQHLLKHVRELRILRLLARLAVSALAGEVVPRPRERALRRAAPARTRAGAGLRLGRVVGVGAGEGVGVGGAAAAAAEEPALGVVFAAPGLVREGVVGVVDYLELAGAGGALGGVLGDAVGVGFEGGSGMG